MRYRAVDVRIWCDKKFRLLSPISPCGQGLFLYLLTNPNTNAIPGLYRAGMAAMAEELGWTNEGFIQALNEIVSQGLIKVDLDARVVFIPNAIKFNKPQSPNVVRSWALHWDEIPECDLKINAYTTIKVFVEELGEAFAKAFAEAIDKTKPNQEHDFQSGRLNDDDLQKVASAIPKFYQAKLFVDDRSSLLVSDIRSKCMRIKRGNGLSLVIVDYISLMAGEGENETIRVGNISRGLKLLARDLNVPVIAISQLNRGVEQRSDKRPTMSDLRQSGAIEQDADLILFIYRDEIYNKNTTHQGIAEVIIAKHRNGGLGTVNLRFSGQYCRFDNYAGNLPFSKDISWNERSFIY